MTEARPRRSPNPALVLFFLSPMVAELLTGSAPPAEFFRPFGFVMLCALYGSGAVLVRELVVRWRKGWPSILVLGMAYGIVEEGLMVKSFFDPNWMDLGRLGHYGRWGGVNVLWSAGLTLFHSVWSIGIPILLVEALFPENTRAAWVGRRSLRFLGVLLAADVVLGFLFLTPYRPPVPLYFLACAAVVALAALARRLPATWALASRPEPEGSGRHGSRALLTGLSATLAFFFLLWGVPNTGIPAIVDLLLIGLLVAGTFARLRRLLCPSPWQTQRALALAAGALTFFILLAPLQAMDSTRPDNTAGMTLVGLAGAAFLVWTWNRATRRPPSGASGALAGESTPATRS